MTTSIAKVDAIADKAEALGKEIKNSESRFEKLFIYEADESMIYEDGLLRTRPIVELSARLYQSTTDWLKDNGLSSMEFRDLDAAFSLMKIMAARKKGGRFTPPVY